MRNQILGQTYRRLFQFGVLVVGVLIPIGCASERGDKMAFRRFWGFDQTSPHQKSGLKSSGLVTKLWADQEARSDFTQDPFLDGALDGASQSAEESAKTTRQQAASPKFVDAGAIVPEKAVASSSVLFEAPPDATLAVKKTASEAESSVENPFQQVQHQTPVNEISSAETADAKSPAVETADSSQLKRLKVALSRDAKTQLPLKPIIAGVEVARQRVEAMMRNARRQMQLGEYDSALRWATAAEQLADHSELFFGPEEDPPADLVRSLQDRLRVAPESQPADLNAQAEPFPATTPMSDLVTPPALSVDTPDARAENIEISPIPPAPDTAPTLPHSTQAMKEAVIAPETVTTDPLPKPNSKPIEIVPQQLHSRSLKVDARRVNANQGAIVSVEGQLNPPPVSPLPQVPLAPPASEEESELPPFEIAMTEPDPISAITKPAVLPPLPPPSSMPEPAPMPSQFLSADDAPPEPKPVKNVRWEEPDSAESAYQWTGWAFPLMAGIGGLLIGLLLLKRKQV